MKGAYDYRGGLFLEEGREGGRQLNRVCPCFTPKGLDKCLRAVSSKEVYPPATGNVKASNETSRQGRAEAGRWGRLSLADIKEQHPRFLPWYLEA